MKRFGKFLATLFVAVLLFSMTAFANETCALAETMEGECEIWWMYDNTQHWRACVNHRDRAGNDTRVTEPEAHTFVDGVCTVCEREEVTGFLAEKAYWIVIVVIAGIGYIIVTRYRSPKLGRDDVTTFGLDKYKKFR